MTDEEIWRTAIENAAKRDDDAAEVAERNQRNLVEPIDERVAFERRRDALRSQRPRAEKKLDTMPASIDQRMEELITHHLDIDRVQMAEVVDTLQQLFAQHERLIERVALLEVLNGELQRQAGAADFRTAQAAMHTDDDSVVDLSSLRYRRHDAA